jgi:hypothetical protein
LWIFAEAMDGWDDRKALITDPRLFILLAPIAVPLKTWFSWEDQLSENES